MKNTYLGAKINDLSVNSKLFAEYLCLGYKITNNSPMSSILLVTNLFYSSSQRISDKTALSGPIEQMLKNILEICNVRITHAQPHSIEVSKLFLIYFR